MGTEVTGCITKELSARFHATLAPFIGLSTKRNEVTRSESPRDVRSGARLRCA